MKKALVVIDVQKAFINKNTKALPEAIRKYIIKNRHAYDFLLFTRFVNFKNSNFVKLGHYTRCFGPPDTDIHPLLDEFLTENNVFVKHTFSPFKSEEFVKYIKKNNVDELHICGTDTEACVLSTIIDAFDAGYNIKFLEELSGSHNGPAAHKAGCLAINTGVFS